MAWMMHSLGLTGLEAHMKAFTDYRRLVWIGGIATLILGFIVAALVLPSTSDPTQGLGPKVDVPNMQNVPPVDQHMKVDVEEPKP
jgi:hypothetical protein